jgi:hypothetical protein
MERGEDIAAEAIRIFINMIFLKTNTIEKGWPVNWLASVRISTILLELYL